MPSINEVIERISRVKPVVGVDERDMARWLIELDGRIYRETTGKSEPDIKPPEKWPEDGDKPLLISEEHSQIYVLWVTMMLEFTMREYGNYNNTAGLYNDAMSEFLAWYRREHPVGSGNAYKNILY